MVLGAGEGDCSINGRYVLIDTQNGRPKYKLEHGQAVMYFQEKWKIAESEGAVVWLYQHPDATGTPPTGPWTIASGAPPAPSVYDEAEDRQFLSVLVINGVTFDRLTFFVCRCFVRCSILENGDAE